MKYYFTLGGLVGFLLTFTSSLFAGSDADGALRDAALGSIAVALLFRWLRSTVLGQLTNVLRERARALADAASRPDSADDAVTAAAAGAQ